MTSLKRCLFLAALVAPLLSRAEAPLTFAKQGFSISPIEQEPASGNQQLVILFMPTLGKFTPNVNVQAQAFEGSLEDYMKISREQFKTMGLTMISETPSKTGVVFEYAGTQQGMALHSYARVVQGKKKIFLITSIASEESWKTVSAALKKCVDSFKPT